MASRYWVGGTGNSNDTAHWSTVSGGASGASVPTATDDVFFDANSGGGVWTVISGQNVRDFVATGFTGSVTGATLSINGTIATIGASMSSATGFIASLQPGAGNTCTLTTNSKTIQVINIINGTTSLGDTLTMTGLLTQNGGTWNTNNLSVSAASISSSNSTTRTMNLGTSTITLTANSGLWNCQTSTNLTVNGGSSTITLTGSNAEFRGGQSSTGASLAYGTVNFTGAGSAQLAYGTLPTFVNVSRTGTAVKTDTFIVERNFTCSGTFTVTGNSTTNRVLVQSSTVGSARTVTAAATSISNADFSDITGAGAANWNLSNDSTVTWTIGGTGGNLFTADQSSMETSLADWTGENCTLARDTTTPAAHGSASVQATNTNAAQSAGFTNALSGIVPGASYFFTAALRSVGSNRVLQMKVRWYDASNNQIGSSVFGGNVNATTTGWVTSTMTLVAPAGAAKVRLMPSDTLNSVGAQFNFDQVGLYQLTIGGSGDAGGNSGITFTTAAQQFWRNNGGNWSDATHWSLTSGGGATGRVPLPQDGVRFDANSFSIGSQTATADMPRLGKDIDFTGSTNSPAWTSSGVSPTLYGSLTLIAAMTWGTGANLTFAGRSTHTITSAGNSVGNNGTVTFAAPGATYSLSDALSCLGAIVLNNGTLNSGGFAITCSTFTSTGTFIRALTLGTSTVSLTQTAGATSPWNVTATGLTLSAASSTIIYTGANNNVSSVRNFIGGGLAYGALTYTVAVSASILNVTGANTFDTLNISGGARTLTLPSGSTTTVSNWNVFGTAGNLVTVNSSTPGSQATLSKSSGIVSTDYLSIQDSAATGGANWYAGSNSVNVSNNSGWIFSTNTNVTGGFMTFFR